MSPAGLRLPPLATRSEEVAKCPERFVCFESFFQVSRCSGHSESPAGFLPDASEEPRHPAETVYCHPPFASNESVSLCANFAGVSVWFFQTSCTRMSIFKCPPPGRIEAIDLASDCQIRNATRFEFGCTSWNIRLIHLINPPD